MADEFNPDDLEVLPSHRATVGALQVRRALPQRRRRTVGAWCFADHMGPADVTEGSGLDIGPHPHTGLQTVTWLVDGQALHRDSLGSEQVIAAGDANVMSAGLGVAHAEEATGHYRGTLQGIQLWIAQDDDARHGPAAFQHLDDLPRVEVGAATATIFVGEYQGQRSRARCRAGLVGLELRSHGATDATLALDPGFEYGVIVLEGEAQVDGTPLTAGALGYRRPGRDELGLRASAGSTIIVLGGVPLDHEILMWWNFVARTREEIDAAYDSWMADDGRFGTVTSPLERIATTAPYWRGPRP